MFRITGLEKSYRKLRVLDGVDLHIGPGELVGLIGPNGCGKSTTLQIASGLLVADAGDVEIAGHSIRTAPLDAKRQLGYGPQEMALAPFLTGDEFLRFVADVRGVPTEVALPEIDELLGLFELAPARHRLTREYSEGMSRKLSIAAAVLGRPAVVLLDETLNGLDPQSAWKARGLLEDLAQRGTTVILTTHILSMVQQMATRVAIMHRGRIALELGRAELDAQSRLGRTLEEVYLEHVGFAVDRRATR
jgi:ABC-2 type transport system ATP-binding protein